MQAVIQKWGNSHAIRLPRILLKTAGFSEKDTLEILASEGEIVMKKNTKKHIPLATRMKGWKAAIEPSSEVDWGKAEGEEVFR